ncbi:MAG: ribosome biogenesis GTPase Der [Planctomycetota bacterium]|nr:ribosome biogenesis GTPase Der [Planctomycetota bacterium]
MLPVVAIVGRPNVGKSSLLNALLGRRLAIVDPMAGVTRDRVSSPVPLGDRVVELVDTGGIGIVDRQDLEEHVEAQILQALESAAVAIFVTDGREGLTPMDREIANALRGHDLPLVLAVNKTESEEARAAVPEFGAVGLEPFAISATQRFGLNELCAAVVEKLPEPEGEEALDPDLNLAVVGRVNVGKSTFINRLAGGVRAIVSEIPGTTRDSFDVRIDRDGKLVQITDTAGIKKEAAVQDSVDFYAQRRAEVAIDRAEGILLLLDCTDDLTRGDRKIARKVRDSVKPVVIVGNKWDLADGHMDKEKYVEYVRKTLPGLVFAPIVLCSAQTGDGVDRVLEDARRLQQQASHRVSTSEINRVLERTRTDFRPPVRLRREPKIYYGTQIEVNPPTLMLFVNDPRIFRQGYRRFLENRFRKDLPFKEIPIRVIYKRRRSIFAKRES